MYYIHFGMIAYFGNSMQRVNQQSGGVIAARHDVTTPSASTYARQEQYNWYPK
jgi:hypothetical protein